MIASTADEFTVLGVDLASRRWGDIGSALVSFATGGPNTCLWVIPSALSWPDESALTPTALADAINEFARENHVKAVSLDGPQGWRDPNASTAQGVGRACEQSAHTPGKTGPHGRTFPANQIGWISFSIEVFDRLLQQTWVQLANAPGTSPRSALPGGEYFLLECFPTVTWRSSGLAPLPAKSRRPNTATFAATLAGSWSIPSFGSAISHDDLQAVVAALPAAALLGAGHPISHGVPARTLLAHGAVPAHRVEGIIWDARP